MTNAQTRRTVLRGMALGGLSVAVSACAGTSTAQAPVTPPPPPPTTPDGALQRLLEGNKRLLANQTLHPQTLDDIRKHATGQAPYAQVFGCADSRVPVEAVFDEDFGDVFVTRTAGNVLSHQSCGAVKAAVDAMKDPAKLPTGALGALVSALLPAAREAKDRGSDIYPAALEAHIRSVVTTLQATPSLAGPIAAGTLRVVGASYDLATGKVSLY